VEAVITDQDVNEDRQLKDVEATFRSVQSALGAIDLQLTKALADAQARPAYW
jgi:hypothetical protein